MIEEQKDEWRASISKFDTLWLSEGKRPRFNSSALSLGEGGDFGELPSISRVLPKGEIDARVAELQQSIALISKEVESDLKLFKSRWGATTDKLEALPANLTRITSLAAARMYVADTVFAGDVPALLTSRGAAYQNVTRRMLKTVSLDRPTVSAPASGALGGAPSEAAGTEEASNPVLRPTVASNLRLPARQIAIVTTAGACGPSTHTLLARGTRSCTLSEHPCLHAFSCVRVRAQHLRHRASRSAAVDDRDVYQPAAACCLSLQIWVQHHAACTLAQGGTAVHPLPFGPHLQASGTAGAVHSLVAGDSEQRARAQPPCDKRGRELCSRPLSPCPRTLFPA